MIRPYGFNGRWFMNLEKICIIQYVQGLFYTKGHILPVYGIQMQTYFGIMKIEMCTRVYAGIVVYNLLKCKFKL